jgi:hypothetical protein
MLLRITERRFLVPQVHFDGGTFLEYGLYNRSSGHRCAKLFIFFLYLLFLAGCSVLGNSLIKMWRIYDFETTELLYSSKQACYLLSLPSI